MKIAADPSKIPVTGDAPPPRFDIGTLEVEYWTLVAVEKGLDPGKLCSCFSSVATAGCDKAV